MYLDANNLYWWSMSQSLPTSNCKWLTDEEMKELDLMLLSDDSSKGCIFVCDLGKYYFFYLCIYVYFINCSVSFLYISEHPLEFPDLQKYYLLAPKCLHIKENIFGNYQCHLLQDQRFSKPPLKLALNLHNKTNYIIHYRNLKLYLELGLHLTNLFLCIDSFIASFIGSKISIFIFICSYILINSLIHSLQVKFLSLCLFVLIYWFLHWLIHRR